jgi:hypothetical protein
MQLGCSSGALRSSCSVVSLRQLVPKVVLSRCSSDRRGPLSVL